MIFCPLQSDVRAQDAVFIVVAVAMNSRGREMTWNYFKENWQKLSDQYAVSNENKGIDKTTVINI